MYSCQQCQLVSSDRDSFNRHQREHLGTDVLFLRNKIGEDEEKVALENTDDDEMKLDQTSVLDLKDTSITSDGADISGGEIFSILQRYQYLNKDEVDPAIIVNEDSQIEIVSTVDGDTSPPLPAMKTEVLKPFIELGKEPADTVHKTFKCPYCSKNLANTKEHIKSVHLKEKNHFCQRCEYKTLFKSDLLKHDELVHQKIKKSCPHCGKQVANLHEHIRLVHKREKKFQCNYCGYSCVKQSDMRKHSKNVHKVGANRTQ